MYLAAHWETSSKSPVVNVQLSYLEPLLPEHLGHCEPVVPGPVELTLPLPPVAILELCHLCEIPQGALLVNTLRPFLLQQPLMHCRVFVRNVLYLHLKAAPLKINLMSTVGPFRSHHGCPNCGLRAQ